ncbi:MAG: hypothetical protein HYS81_03205 [Candidatus Aenigmatarchaeota archaeon]|nr:MAG: hypothetical protein HYS81_03205 [Candidatus Aenigmarchaeota archaeon]
MADLKHVKRWLMEEATDIKKSWGPLLAPHDYDTVVETHKLANTLDWENGRRGGVAFWKGYGTDGVAVQNLRQYSGGAGMSTTGVLAIGPADDYFERLGYNTTNLRFANDLFGIPLRSGQNGLTINGIRRKGIEYSEEAFGKFLRAKLRPIQVA